MSACSKIERARTRIGLVRSRRLRAAEVILIEISSLEEFVLDGLRVQGNLNADRNVPYAEVWKEGYCHHYEPQLGVAKHHAAHSETVQSVGEVRERLGCPVVLVPHLVPSTGGASTRTEIWEMVRESAHALGVAFIDTKPLVDEFGFRRLHDGTKAIHHLPVDGCMAFAGKVARVTSRLR